jgi:polyhydroxyalkanoate synthesis regulator protein
MITLIKYENRKIYSKDANRHVNLDEILEAVKDGEVLRIIEHRTNRDVTSEVLNQALSRYAPLTVNQIYTILRK